MLPHYENTALMADIERDYPAYEVKRNDYARGHGYEITPDIGKVPSVTQIVRAVINKADFLGPWHARMAIEGLIRLSDTIPNCLMREEGESIEDAAKRVKEWLKRERLGAQDTMNKAGDRGTAVHQQMEVFFQTGRLPNPELAHPADKGFVAGGRAFLESVKPKLLASEQVVGSARYRYAGTFDGRAAGTFTLADNTTISVENAIIDYKTSKRVYPDHRLQLRGYDVAAIEMGEEPADALLIVHITPTGKFKVYRSDVTPDQWVAAVEWFHAYQEVEGA